MKLVKYIFNIISYYFNIQFITVSLKSYTYYIVIFHENEKMKN